MQKTLFWFTVMGFCCGWIACSQPATGPLPQYGLFCQKDADCVTPKKCVEYVCVVGGQSKNESPNADRPGSESTKESTQSPDDAGTDRAPQPEEANTPEPNQEILQDITPDRCGPVELCGDKLDNNCDGQIDENCGCKDDKECPLGLCLQTKCVTDGCRTPNDCKGGKVCKNNLCSACTQEADCPNGSLCQGGLCQIATCKINKDCVDGKICQAGSCTDCSKDSECDSGSRCLSKRCRPPECIQNSNCTGGKVCKSNKCVNCTQNTDCGGGTVCEAGLCKKPECIQNSNCTGGKVCKSNKCVSCTQNTDCGGLFVCQQGVCQSGCRSNGDCHNGQVCTNNRCVACTQNIQCNTGEICERGSCQKPQCTKNSDCQNAQVCATGRCVACTQTSQCSQGYACMAGKCLISTEISSGASRWSDGTYGVSCNAYRRPTSSQYVPSTQSGVFWIKPAGVSQAFRVYCYMQFTDGGWTLVLKGRGDRRTFRYDAALWADKSTFGTTSLSVDGNEAKFASYHTVPFKEVALFLRTSSTSPGSGNYVIIKKAAASLHALISGGQAQQFAQGIGKTTWKNIVGGGSLQTNCWKEGFNMRGAVGYARVRIGVLANNKSNCDYGESFIGFGAESMPCVNNAVTIGNAAPASNCEDGGDNGYKNNFRYGYVFVR